MACTGYVIFFYEQFDQFLKNVTNNPTLDYDYQIFMLSLTILIPLTIFFESMKQISYISGIAMFSILIALLYVLLTDIHEIRYPTFDKTYIFADFSGIPYFFGIALFMFEGNALSLEIYQ